MFKEEKITQICKKNNWRLTKPRLEVLKIISLSKKPIKAYDILKKLANKIKNPKPPTAYRAIDFWQKHNFIHRVESLNAYAACSGEHADTGTQFLICDDCGKVACLPDSITSAISLEGRWARSIEKAMIQISGTCPDCLAS